MIERPLISIVIPEYNGAGMVRELVERIKKSVSVISDNFEISLRLIRQKQLSDSLTLSAFA